MVVPGPQPRHIAPQAQVRAPRALVHVVRLAVAPRGALAEEVSPPGVPLVQGADEGLFVRVAQEQRQPQQFLRGRQLGARCQLVPDELHPMELTELELVLRECHPQPLLAVADDAAYDEAAPLKPKYAFPIVGYRFLLDQELVPQHAALQRVFHDDYPEVTSPVGRIHQHDHLSCLRAGHLRFWRCSQPAVNRAL